MPDMSNKVALITVAGRRSIRMVGNIGELGHVQLAKQYRARGLEPLHGGCTPLGHIAAEDPRGAARRLDPRRVEQILDGHRYAVQRAEVMSFRLRLLGSPRRLNGAVGSDLQIGMHLRIERFDAPKVRVHDLGRRHLLRANRPARRTIDS